MRSPSRKRQYMWFCTVTEENDGIDRIKVYSKPIRKKYRVSWTMGYVRGTAVGWDLTYDRYIDCYDRRFNPPEGTMVFVDVIPKLDKDGNLAQHEVTELDANGNPILDENDSPVTHMEYYTEPDYIIRRVLDTQKGIVSRFVIKRV